MTRVGISPFSYFTVKQKPIELWWRDARSYFRLKRKSHSEDYGTVSPSAGWECSYSSTLRRVTHFQTISFIHFVSLLILRSLH